MDGTLTPAVTAPGGFFATAMVFTAAHGGMLALLFLMVVKIAPDAGDLHRAVMALLAFQGLAFGVDLWTLEQWPARRVNERADHLLGRVVLVHLSIIAGMLLAAWLERPSAFFGFFVGCKVLSDLTQFLPRVATGPGTAPPRWLSTVMRRLPSKDGRTFEEHWARTQGTARRLRIQCRQRRRETRRHRAAQRQSSRRQGRGARSAAERGPVRGHGADGRQTNLGADVLQDSAGCDHRAIERQMCVVEVQDPALEHGVARVGLAKGRCAVDVERAGMTGRELPEHLIDVVGRGVLDWNLRNSSQPCGT